MTTDKSYYHGKTGLVTGSGIPQEQAIGALSLLNRPGRPEEIAKAALWLCSDDASFTYGHALAVDGGYLSR